MLGRKYMDAKYPDQAQAAGGDNQDKIVGFYKKMLAELKNTVQEERPQIQ